METFRLPASDGLPLFTHRWWTGPDPRAVVQIVHGMAEHAGRYAGLAQALNAAGYAVCAHDQRGHGQTAPSAAELGDWARGDWARCLDDLARVRRQIADDFPDKPVFLLGHSMGSFLAQQFAAQNNERFAGLILSGGYRESRLLARAGTMLAQIERQRLGPRGRSRLLRALTFGRFNRRFAPARTRFDWLSRDAAEVDRYIADPRCGFDASVALWSELLGALAAGLPLPSARLPVCVMVGERDPVGAIDPGADRLVAELRRDGRRRVAQLVYPEARHELAHETNCAEFARDLISWMDSFVVRE